MSPAVSRPHLRCLVGLLLVGTLVTGNPSPVVAAAKCQILDGHQVCLEAIKRSAKYPWEYRVTVRVDGQKQPEQRHDCRQAIRDMLPAQGTADLTKARTRQWICRLVGN